MQKASIFFFIPQHLEPFSNQASKTIYQNSYRNLSDVISTTHLAFLSISICCLVCKLYIVNDWWNTYLYPLKLPCRSRIKRLRKRPNVELFEWGNVKQSFGIWKSCILFHVDNSISCVGKFIFRRTKV